MLASIIIAVAVLAARHSSLPVRAYAQIPEPRAITVQVADSVAMLRAVRGAQGKFERVRFNNLPWSRGVSGGNCNEIIGRYCITHGDADDKWTPPAEPRRVANERDALIATLDSVALRLPGDHWVAGQRIRYLLEAERHADAFAASQACRSEKWWCTSLHALVEHKRERFYEADSLFQAALAEMPAKERSRWRDLKILLTGENLRVFRQSTPERQELLASWLWWLADPLWMRAGNDRRTEHYARYVIDLIYRDSRTPEGAFWASDLAEILIRYGPMAGWERVRPNGSDVGWPAVVGHFLPNGREFLPDLRWFDDSIGIPDEWTLGADGTKTEYIPSYARSFHRLEHQLAVFRRGDSAVVVAAYQLPADSTPISAAVESGLVLASDEGTTLAAKRESSLGGRGVLSAIVAATPAVVSIEALADSGRQAYRARFGLPIAHARASTLALSHVLLLETAGINPRTLEDAVPRARGTTSVKSGERVSMYWEVYGLRVREESLQVELALEPLDQKWLRRTAERLRIRTAVPTVRLRWRDQLNGQAVMPRALDLELPRLPRGRYVLRIKVSRGGSRRYPSAG
ncbi:MAG: hypothetical protein ACR2G6_16305 [Gemmatimonadaceae bacterium]